jgi:hypothetical protein
MFSLANQHQTTALLIPAQLLFLNCLLDHPLLHMKYTPKAPALEDGTVFHGKSAGYSGWLCLIPIRRF